VLKGKKQIVLLALVAFPSLRFALLHGRPMVRDLNDKAMVLQIGHDVTMMYFRIHENQERIVFFTCWDISDNIASLSCRVDLSDLVIVEGHPTPQHEAVSYIHVFGR
jgi:hypothetical protein